MIPAAIAAGSLVFGILSESALSQEPSIAELDGVYQNVEPDGGRGTIAAGTDQALSDAGWLLRSIARPRILENNPPVKRLIIEIEEGYARVTYEGERSYRAPIGGPAVKHRAPDGSEVRIRYEADGAALVEIAEASRGGGRIRYERRNGELLVRTIIESSRLPEPVRFTLRFRPR